MSERSDAVRSMVNQAALQLRGRFSLLRPLRRLQKRFENVRARAGTISTTALSKAIGRAHGVSAASVVLRDGSIRVDASFDDGGRAQVSFLPEETCFAPHGAKEIAFRVDPPECAQQASVRDLAGALAAAVAHALWGPLLGSRERQFDAIAEQDGSRIRIDLRSVPAVRNALRGSLAPMFDVLALSGLVVLDGTLRMHVRIPWNGF